MASEADALPPPTVAEADRRAVALRDVEKSYAAPAGPTPVLHGVSLDVSAGQLVAVTGRAGAGISTLLRIVACLDRADAGQVWVAGADAGSSSRAARRELRRRSIGVVAPRPADGVLLQLDVGANLVWAAKRRTRAVLNHQGVEAHLEMVGLGGLTRKRPADLTPGDQHRLALACALAGEPAVVVADDPTGLLDREEAARLTNAYRDAADRGVAVLVGTHDPVLAAAADVAVGLELGRSVVP